jgi:hypothetical protein
MFPDILINNNIIIECYGDYWHCNPDIFNSNYYHKQIRKTAKEIWLIDKERVNILVNNGYNVIIIWENDYKTKKITLNEIKKKIMRFTKIKKIEKTSNKPVYHLTVNKNHNFFGNNLCLHNCGYRGELMATFVKTKGLDSFKYSVGDRIGQIVILPYPMVKFILSENLSESERNSGGFGSTGN